MFHAQLQSLNLSLLASQCLLYRGGEVLIFMGLTDPRTSTALLAWRIAKYFGLLRACLVVAYRFLGARREVLAIGSMLTAS